MGEMKISNQKRQWDQTIQTKKKREKKKNQKKEKKNENKKVCKEEGKKGKIVASY